MKHPDIEDAVNAALDRLGAMMGAEPDQEAAGTMQLDRAGLAFASLDVNPDEVFDVAHRVTASFLAQIDVAAAPDPAVRGAFLTGYLVGRLHEPGEVS